MTGWWGRCPIVGDTHLPAFPTPGTSRSLSWHRHHLGFCLQSLPQPSTSSQLVGQLGCPVLPSAPLPSQGEEAHGFARHSQAWAGVCLYSLAISSLDEKQEWSNGFWNNCICIQMGKINFSAFPIAPGVGPAYLGVRTAVLPQERAARMKNEAAQQTLAVRLLAGARVWRWEGPVFGAGCASCRGSSVIITSLGPGSRWGG